MIILRIVIGIISAIGVGMILADAFKMPTMKASKATHSLGKKGDKKTSVVELYIKDFAEKISRKIKLNEYKREQLDVDLKTAGLDISPEMYISESIIKAV